MAYSEAVEKLVRKGSQFIGEKRYEEAVEVLGEACGLNSEETGEMDPDLFFLYGKALYENGVSKSDVLGGQEVTNEKIEEAKGSVEESDGNFQFNDLAAEVEDEEEGDEDDEQDPDEEEGDEEDGPQEEEDDEEDPQEGDEEEKTDMELAWDMLELARGLYQQKVDDLKPETAPKAPYLESDKSEPTDPYVKVLKLLSEVYDLLGEVSLESEHFQQAASDLETCLSMRKELYDSNYSSLVGESHFKLSLALEFCLDDETSKDKAREHIKAAIKIIENDSDKNPDKKKENDEIIISLQERYDDIETSTENAINQQKEAMLEGILGNGSGSEMLGKMLQTTSKPVNDLSGLVKKRKPTNKDDKNKRLKKSS